MEGHDPVSPTAPARVRVLVLPVGRIKKSRFMSFVSRLQQESAIRLGDISPDGRPDKNMFSPLAFPNGTLLYHFSASMPPASHLALTPFELFRGPMMVIGLADASEYSEQTADPADGQMESRRRELNDGMQQLGQHYPKVLLKQLLLMDCPAGDDSTWIPKDALRVPPRRESKSTTLKTIICDVSARLLAEMAGYAKAIQSLPTVQSPGSSHSASQSVVSEHRPRPRLERQNSGRSVSSRTESPAPGSKHLSLSMRNVSSPQPSIAGDSRPDSRGPPTSFEEMPDAGIGAGLTRSTSRASNSEGGRPTSRERMSVHSFASAKTLTAEKAQIKGKARVGIVVGMLYLLAGRWSDAWRELLESTNKARSVSDHLWHAKGVENLLACMLLFAWAGFEFQVPPICISGFERSSSLDLFKDPPNSLGLQDPAAATHARQRLAKALPDIVATILSFYERASSLSGDPLPPLARSEMVLRLTKLLSMLLNANSELGADLLDNLVKGTAAHQPLRRKSRAIVMPGLTKQWIADVLFQAWPSPNSGLSLADTIAVLSGIASVLSMLQLDRKRAVVLKEIVAQLVPALVQARKLGAAELGIHPAATLTIAGGLLGPNLSGDEVFGIDSVLSQLHTTYGTFAVSQEAAVNGTRDQASSTLEVEETLIDAVVRATGMATSSASGSLNLKIDILRACIDFCEALPDLAGSVRFISLLLRSAGPNAAVSASHRDRHVSLSNEEQVRMVSTIIRTNSASSTLGNSAIEAAYWDDFLVRDVQALDAGVLAPLVEHSKQDLESQQQVGKSPFLFDAFAKKADRRVEEKIVVAGEPIELAVTLQNPYDVEMTIERFQFVTNGGQLKTDNIPWILGPARIQTIRIIATATDTGPLTIQGSFVKFQGCSNKFFPIYQLYWTADPPMRIKNIGIQPLKQAAVARDSNSVPAIPATQSVQISPPTTYTTSMTVIAAQPQIIVEDVSLPESALMVLEGERKAFQVILRNTSDKFSTDFLHVSFEDTLTGSVRAAVASKTLSRADMYELELQLSQDPIFKWSRLDGVDPSVIEPGKLATFEISIVGRPGLGAAKILFDIAHLGKPSVEAEGRFFTRQISVPLDITVNASVQLHRVDISPFPMSFAWGNHRREQEMIEMASRAGTPRSRRSSSRAIEKGSSRFRGLLDRVGLDAEDQEHILLLLDLRNAWPNPLVISVDVSEQLAPTGDFDGADGKWKRAYTGHEVIHPGHIARMVLLLPRMYLRNPHAPIPTLSRQGERQFVVGAEKASPQQERALREAFWYREIVLQHLKGTWREEGSERKGELNLRELHLSPRMVDAIRLEDVAISMTVVAASPQQTGAAVTNSSTDTHGSAVVVRQIGRSRFEVKVDEFITLKTKIRNRTDAPIRSLLRLQPRLSGQPQDAALDVGRRVMWTGLLQRPLPVLLPRQTLELELGLCVLSSGDYEIGASLEETQVPAAASAARQAMDKTGDFEAMGGLESRERRVWHAREACAVHAKTTLGMGDK